MFRVAHAIVTIAGMLFCPFVCMAKAGPCPAPAAQRAECPCCQHRCQDPTQKGRTDDGPREPERHVPTPAEDCFCPCLCKGAVFTEGAPKLGFAEQAALVVWFDSTSITKANADSQDVFSFTEAPPPPKLGSGRLTRLALASLLL